MTRTKEVADWERSPEYSKALYEYCKRKDEFVQFRQSHEFCDGFYIYRSRIAKDKVKHIDWTSSDEFKKAQDRWDEYVKKGGKIKFEHSREFADGRYVYRKRVNSAWNNK